jgi:hypothetical protein
MKESINFFNLMNDVEITNSNLDNLNDIFFDANAKFDSMSQFLKGRIFFKVLNHLKSKSKDLIFENSEIKTKESKN